MNKTLKEREKIADLLEKVSEAKIWSLLDKKDCGSIFKNFQGILEHF